MNIQNWSPLGWTGWISLQSKGLSRVFSNTTVQKHQFFAPQVSLYPNSHIHTWPVEKVSEFILGGSRITADGYCSHEIKRLLLLGRKVMTNLDSILKSRDIALSTKVHVVKAVLFLGVMYGCECWTIKKAEWRRIDAFELWCWRRLLRVLGLQGDPTSPS